MLRTTSRLSRPVLKWVSQVTASVGATLAATLIWSAVPHPSASPAPQPEMTSGGKFAARASEAVAYDGLDTMPLPRVAPLPTVVASAAPAPWAEALHRAAWEGASPFALAPDRPARAAHPAHAPARAEARRAAPVEAPPAAVAAVVAEPAEGDGFVARTVPKILPALASTARGAWAVTASAGESLVSRVVQQIP